MKRLQRIIRYMPLLLLTIVAASIFLYNKSDVWASLYPYIIQLYPSLMLICLLFYATIHHHEAYLKIIYIGLIDLNILNCVTEYFKIEDWLPYSVILISITVVLILYFLIKNRHGPNKRTTTTKRG